MLCALCPRACNKERGEHEGAGLCRMGTNPRLARAALHFGEEPPISTGGSGAVFFSGCTLKCVYCQNYKISHENFGKEVSIEALKNIYQSLISQGARNINLVSGTQFVPQIIESLTPAPGVPVIWNSSGYEKIETLRLLKGHIDVYLPDLKYMDGDLAFRLSAARDYPEVACAAIEEMLNQTGRVRINKKGNITRGTIVRHLVLPGQIQNTKMVLKYFKENLFGAYLSLMAQYTPMGAACDYPDINRPITQEEYASAVEYMESLNITNGFVQELSSAKSEYTPEFDLTGIF